MSFQSLIAHNGVIHHKSSPVEKHKPSTTETKTNQKSNIDSPTVVPEGNSTPEKHIVETPEVKTDTIKETEALSTTETPVTPNLASATLVSGFGESIFTLLIVSPFLLLGFKKWLHR